jgi:hypothetical protein
MNAKKLLGICALALLVVGWGIMPAVLEADEPPGGGPASDGNDAPSAQSVGPRHSITQVETLGAGANNIDAWALLCPNGTHHIHFDVFDHPGSTATIGIVCTDFNPSSGFSAYRRAPQGGISPSGQQNGGSGYYVCYVFKTSGTSTVTYDSLQVCHTATHGFLNHPTGFPNHYIFQDQ